MADAWVAMSAIATATEAIRIGPLVTPLARRRVQKLARETVSLDYLSRGRLTLGVGLGTDHGGELSSWGEERDPRRRAELLDERLERLAELWAGEFQPPPVQRPRIPVWIAGRYPHRRPLVRAAGWDGFFPIELPDPDALTELAAELAALRGDRDGDCDLVAETGPGEDPSPWAAAGRPGCWLRSASTRGSRRSGRRSTPDPASRAGRRRSTRGTGRRGRRGAAC